MQGKARGQGRVPPPRGAEAGAPGRGVTGFGAAGAGGSGSLKVPQAKGWVSPSGFPQFLVFFTPKKGTPACSA